MSTAASGAPLVDPPTGAPVPGPPPAGGGKNRRTVGIALFVGAVAAATVWAMAIDDSVDAPDDAAGSLDATPSVDSAPPAIEADSGTGAATTANVEAVPDDDIVGDEPAVDDATVAASGDETDPDSAVGEEPAASTDEAVADAQQADTDASADDVESTLEEIEAGTDKLAEADEDDVLVLSLPTGEPVPVGQLQPLTATIRGENVFLEGTAPSAAIALDYERQAIEIWGDKVVAQYSIDSRAPEPRADDVVLEKPVLFEPGSAVIDPDYLPVLDACFEFLTTYPAVSMIVEGHTDDVGSDQYNLELSQQRADAIVAYYRQLGLEPERLVTVASGEAEPLEDNTTEEGRGANRRIDLALVGALNARTDDASSQ